MKQILMKLRQKKVSFGPILLAIPPITGSSNRVSQFHCDVNDTGPFSSTSCATSTLFDRLLNLSFVIITSLAIIFLIWSGIQYIQAGGNQENAKKARQRIINIVIAIILLTIAYFILNLITGGATYLAGLFGS